MDIFCAERLGIILPTTSDLQTALGRKTPRSGVSSSSLVTHDSRKPVLLRWGRGWCFCPGSIWQCLEGVVNEYVGGDGKEREPVGKKQGGGPGV